MSGAVVLVPLDGSEAALAALPVARALGEAFGASLRIVHVGPEAQPPLADLVERLGLPDAALEAWSVEAQVGEPSQAILGAARELSTRFIVMCPRAAGRSRAVLGRTALAVLKDAPCDVVLVSQPTLKSWSAQRILAPYDGSPEGGVAVALAADLARHMGCEIILLQVGVAGLQAAGPRGSLSMPRYVDQPHHEWANWASELIDQLSCLCPGGELKARVKIRAGDPGREILQLAAEDHADLIVLGWKGVWIGDRARTLKSVLRAAPCPLAVARIGAGLEAPASPGQAASAPEGSPG